MATQMLPVRMFAPEINRNKVVATKESKGRDTRHGCTFLVVGRRPTLLLVCPTSQVWGSGEVVRPLVSIRPLMALLPESTSPLEESHTRKR